MNRYLYIVAVLFLFVSCKNPCKPYYETPIYEVVDEILQNPEIAPDSYFNILKVVFVESYEGKVGSLEIVNDPFYSEESNGLKLDGWIEKKGLMVAFYRLDLYPKGDDIKPCLNTGEPPAQFLFETKDQDDFNPSIWRFEMDEKGGLKYTGKSPLAFPLSKVRYE